MKEWNKLSMKEKAAFIKVGVANGLTDINSIQKSYSEYANGGDFQTYLDSLPNNQRDSSDFNVRRYWELNGKPKDFEDAKSRGMFTLSNDGYYHANSVAYNANTEEYEVMKSATHPSRLWESAAYLSTPEFNRQYEDKGNKYIKRVPVPYRVGANTKSTGGPLNDTLLKPFSYQQIPEVRFELGGGKENAQSLDYMNELVKWAIDNEGAIWQDNPEAAKARQWLRTNFPEELDSLYWVMSDENRSRVNPKFLSHTINQQVVENKTREGINSAGETIFNIADDVFSYLPTTGGIMWGAHSLGDALSGNYGKAVLDLGMGLGISKGIKIAGKALPYIPKVLQKASPKLAEITSTNINRAVNLLDDISYNSGELNIKEDIIDPLKVKIGNRLGYVSDMNTYSHSGSQFRIVDRPAIDDANSTGIIRSRTGLYHGTPEYLKQNYSTYLRDFPNWESADAFTIQEYLKSKGALPTNPKDRMIALMNIRNSTNHGETVGYFKDMPYPNYTISPSNFVIETPTSSSFKPGHHGSVYSWDVESPLTGATVLVDNLGNSKHGFITTEGSRYWEYSPFWKAWKPKNFKNNANTQSVRESLIPELIDRQLGDQSTYPLYSELKSKILDYNKELLSDKDLLFELLGEYNKNNGNVNTKRLNIFGEEINIPEVFALGESTSRFKEAYPEGVDYWHRGSNLKNGTYQDIKTSYNSIFGGDTKMAEFYADPIYPTIDYTLGKDHIKDVINKSRLQYTDTFVTPKRRVADLGDMGGLSWTKLSSNPKRFIEVENELKDLQGKLDNISKYPNSNAKLDIEYYKTQIAALNKELETIRGIYIPEYGGKANITDHIAVGLSIPETLNNYGYKLNNIHDGIVGGEIIYNPRFAYPKSVYGSSLTFNIKDNTVKADGGSLFFGTPEELTTKSTSTYVMDAAERIHRQAWAESAGDDSAKSSRGAMGRYQIMPDTLDSYVKETNVKGDINDPVYNRKVRDWVIDGILKSQTITRNNPNDVVKAAKIYAAYNWGLGNLGNKLQELKDKGVDIYQSLDWIDSLPKETRDYVKFIVLGEDTGAHRTANSFYKQYPDYAPKSKNSKK